MKRITVKKARKDGKHPVSYFYEGAPNAIGGRDYGKTFNKLHTIEKIRAHDLNPGDIFINQSGLRDSDFFPENE